MNVVASSGPSSSSSNAAAAAAAAARVSPVLTRSAGKRKEPPPPPPPSSHVEAAGSTESEQEKVKDVKKEVRELLEIKLIGQADAVKLETLRKLNEYWLRRANYEEHRRATVEWDGCHLVLIVLRQELYKGANANLQVVQESILFLVRWNCHETDLGDTMLLFDGVDAVARAMEAYPHDRYVQYLAAACFHNVTLTGGAPRRHKLVERGCIPLILRTLAALAAYTDGRKCAVLTLGRLCDVADPRLFDGLVDAAVLEALVQVYKAHKDSVEEVAGACRAVMNKLLA